MKTYLLSLYIGHVESNSCATLLVACVRDSKASHKEIVKDFVDTWRSYFLEKKYDYILSCCARTKEQIQFAKYCCRCGREITVDIDNIIYEEFMKVFNGYKDDLDYELQEYLYEKSFDICVDLSQYRLSECEIIIVDDVNEMFLNYNDIGIYLNMIGRK